MENKVELICRIRPPTQAEMDSLSKKAAVRSSSPCHGKKKSQLTRDQKLNIFASTIADLTGKHYTHEFRSQIVAVSDKPIKNEILEQYIKNDQDIIRYRHSILEGAQTFTYDHVYSKKATNTRIYQTLVQPKIASAMEGFNQTFIFGGPKNSGKVYSFRGGEADERGIMILAVEDLINMIELNKGGLATNTGNYALMGSIYCVINNEVVDLLQQPQKLCKSPKKHKTTEPDDQMHISSQPIIYLTEFKNLYRQAMTCLKSLTMPNTSNQSVHVFAKIQILKNKQLMSYLTFVKLADYDKAETEEYLTLGNYIIDINTKEGRIFSNPAYYDYKLIKCIADTLNRGEDNFGTLFCGVSSLPMLAMKENTQILEWGNFVKEKIDEMTEELEDPTREPRNIRDMNARTIEGMQIDIDEAVRQIFEFSERTAGFEEARIREWVLEREMQIMQLENEMEYLDPIDKKYNFEVGEKKLQEAKRFLVDLKKTSYNSVSFKNKLPMPNESFNNAISSVGQKSISSTRQTTGRNSSRNDVGRIKKSLMDKIDRAISESPRKKKNIIFKQGSKDELNHRRSKKNLHSEPMDSSYRDYVNNQHHKGELQGKVDYLTSSIRKRDQLLGDYQQTINIQQGELERDNRMTDDIKNETTKYRIKLEKKKRELFEAKEKQNQLEMNFLNEKKDMINDKVFLEKQVEELKGLFDSERVKSLELENLLEKTRFDIDHRDNMHEKLKDNFSEADRKLMDVTARLHKEQDHSKDLRINNQVLQKNCEDIAQKCELMEQKAIKIKHKYEQEKKLFSEEKHEEIKQRKQKSNKLKAHLKDLESKLIDLQNEAKMFRVDNERLIKTVDQLKEQLNHKQYESDQMTDKMLNSTDNMNKVRYDNQELAKLLDTQTSELKAVLDSKDQVVLQLDDREMKIQFLTDQIHQQNQGLDEFEKKNISQATQIQAQNEFMSKLEQQNEFLSQMQNKDIEKLINKVENVNIEIKLIRQENDELKLVENSLRQEVDTANRANDQQREKIMKSKMTIRQQKESLDEMDGRIKDLINEKNHEIQNLANMTMNSGVGSPRQIKNHERSIISKNTRDLIMESLKKDSSDEDYQDEED